VFLRKSIAANSSKGKLLIRLGQYRRWSPASGRSSARWSTCRRSRRKSGKALTGPETGRPVCAPGAFREAAQALGISRACFCKRSVATSRLSASSFFSPR